MLWRNAQKRLRYAHFVIKVSCGALHVVSAKRHTKRKGGKLRRGGFPITPHHHHDRHIGAHFARKMTISHPHVLNENLGYITFNKVVNHCGHTTCASGLGQVVVPIKAPSTKRKKEVSWLSTTRIGAHSSASNIGKSARGRVRSTSTLNLPFHHFCSFAHRKR